MFFTTAEGPTSHSSPSSAPPKVMPLASTDAATQRSATSTPLSRTCSNSSMRSSMSSATHSFLWSSRIASASSSLDCDVGSIRCSASGMAAEPCFWATA